MCVCLSVCVCVCTCVCVCVCVTVCLFAGTCVCSCCQAHVQGQLGYSYRQVIFNMYIKFLFALFSICSNSMLSGSLLLLIIIAIVFIDSLCHSHNSYCSYMKNVICTLIKVIQLLEYYYCQENKRVTAGESKK